MKKKYFIKETGKEVKIGGFITRESSVSTEFGLKYSKEIIPITEEILPKLINAGIIVKKEIPEVPMDWEYYVEKLADKQGWSLSKMLRFLTKIDDINEAASFVIILRQIAIELDKKYDDHISKSKEIWSVSTSNGEITKVDKEYIKNYKHFAAFRTPKDAEIALEILKPFIDQMYNND